MDSMAQLHLILKVPMMVWKPKNRGSFLMMNMSALEQTFVQM